MIRASFRKVLKNFTLNVELEIKKNEYAVILGRSGAGKSLTARILAGIEKVDEGKILLEGKEITKLPPEKRGICYLPQNSYLFPHMNVKENLEFPFKVRRKKPEKEKIKKLAESFQISHLMKRRATEISGGEAQRVALARALLSEPKVIILDEPLNSLDFLTKVESVDFLKRLKGNLTFLHITHDPFEAKELSDKIIYLEGGRIIFTGKWESFLKSNGELPQKLSAFSF